LQFQVASNVVAQERIRCSSYIACDDLM